MSITGCVLRVFSQQLVRGPLVNRCSNERRDRSPFDPAKVLHQSYLGLPVLPRARLRMAGSTDCGAKLWLGPRRPRRVDHVLLGDTLGHNRGRPGGGAQGDAADGRAVFRGMEWSDRILIDPKILVGKPVIRGTRLAVEFILDLLATGQPEADILPNYPGLTHDDILACLAYASHLADKYTAYPLPV